MPKTLRPIIHRLTWNSPAAGKVTLTITHTKTFFGHCNNIEIEAPQGVRLPLDTLSYLVTHDELTRAGGAKAFVQQLIRKAENTATWKKEAARLAQGDLFDPTPTANSPAKPQPRRRRPALSAPKR